MIVGNLYFIKNTNGLFYYGADYLRDQTDLIREILVRPALAEAARAMFPGVSIVTCENAHALWHHAKQASHRGDVLYTPTPHPLPLIDRQWVVVHDAYPFLASKGRLKRMLLRLSLAMSRCRVAFINESETLGFVHALGVMPARLIFAPNKVADSDRPPRPASPPALPLKVGLVGTDSSKKRYDELLQAVTAAGLQSSIELCFYGHRTPYFEGVCQRHQEACVTLQESDRCSLDDFLTSIHALVSVADLEGFGRPIAAALTAGVPCLLRRKPVFQEFFSTARFFDDTGSLVAALAEALRSGFPEQPPYSPPTRVREGFRSASATLRSDGRSAPR
ncbi:MAG: glycosyltransferase [Rubritepida sp.]|nr:glycosyltransferase [Rubritepida sp.]